MLSRVFFCVFCGVLILFMDGSTVRGISEGLFESSLTANIKHAIEQNEDSVLFLPPFLFYGR